MVTCVSLWCFNLKTFSRDARCADHSGGSARVRKGRALPGSGSRLLLLEGLREEEGTQAGALEKLSLSTERVAAEVGQAAALGPPTGGGGGGSAAQGEGGRLWLTQRGRRVRA